MTHIYENNISLLSILEQLKDLNEQITMLGEGKIEGFNDFIMSELKREKKDLMQEMKTELSKRNLLSVMKEAVMN
jgi:hypothetical protein